MSYILNKRNSKKILLIWVSILFCIAVLIVGGTTAFFSKSGIVGTGNIITTNLNGTIGYSDNSDYMRGNLIPVIETDVTLFATKNSINNYTNDDICKYQNDMYACSLYEFTLTNNADVSQEMKVTLTPYPNEFGNLYYMVYESKQLELTKNSRELSNKTHIDKVNSSTMIESVEIPSGESKTFTAVFYIKSMNYDQTSEDVGKRFGGIIRVDSITTGDYNTIMVGNTCYDDPEYISSGENAGTYKLTKFNGISEDGEISESCGVTKNGEFYRVVIPSSIGDKKISTLGNSLFNAAKVVETGFSPTVYYNIEEIVISEGITTIENGEFDFDNGIFIGTFLGIGFDFGNLIADPNRSLKVKMPSTLKEIGEGAFAATAIKQINIPSSVERIGDDSFHVTSNVENIYFEKDSNNKTNLKTIGDHAFQNSGITTLELPESYNDIIINQEAFRYIPNLTNVIFSTSVKEIGAYAFAWNENLTRIKFMTDNTGLSKLDTIGDFAFTSCNLTYQSKNDPLILPPNVRVIGRQAFGGEGTTDGGNPNLNYIKYTGTNDLGDNWYYHGNCNPNCWCVVDILGPDD